MIFLDSSFIIACKIADDEHHKKSIDYLTKIISNGDESFVTSDYIFDEVVTAIFAKTKDLEIAKDTGQVLKSAAVILHIDEEAFEKSWEIFTKQKGTKLSFTDCSTLALMEKERIKRVATFDADFKKIKEIEAVGC